MTIPNALRRRLCLLGLCLVLCLGLCPEGVFAEAPAEVQSKTQPVLQSIKARFAASYESLSLPGSESMGLLGGSFLYDMNNWLSFGGSAYGAMAGNRGGFITLGLAGELHPSLGRYLEIQAGAFVGAGGGRGGYTLQGGGLMLRTHLGAMLKLGPLGQIGGGVSRVDFPNGSIHSTQPYLAYARSFHAFLPSGWIDLTREDAGPWLALRTREHEFSLVYRRYFIPRGVLTDGGSPQHRALGLMGVAWNRYLGEHLFLRIESEGAMQGKSHGYMQILLGGGYRLAVTDSTWMKLTTSLGPAGGGSVSTGGGLLLDGQIELQQKLSEHLFAETALGYVNAPSGDFRAWSLSARLGYHFLTPKVDASPLRISSLDGFDDRHLRIRMVDQRYLKDAPDWRNHHADLSVDLLGFQLDYFISNRVFLSGQGIAAYKGKAGGYMTGLVGGGIRLGIPGTAFYVEADMLIGAAGGGGLDVAGGLVWQADAGISWQFAKSYSLQASLGLMQAPLGNFKARVISVSLAHDFSLAVR